MNISQQYEDDARQFDAALRAGKSRGALVVEYTDANGKMHRRFWVGGMFARQASMMYEKIHSPYRMFWTYSASYHPT